VQNTAAWGLTWREGALAALMFVPLVVMFLAVAAIPQDVKYHLLADARTCLSIPNFANVVTNVGFLIVGAMGLDLCLRKGVNGASLSWTTFFAGTLLVAAGSAYYHWNPNNATLVWDRLPMTIAFMALLAALFAEHVRSDLERSALVIALAVGIGSVVWWRYTDDLRLYGWVQFGPLLAIIFMLALYPGRFSHRSYLVYGLICYALSKAAELGDHALFTATSGAISGHSVKHLLAALAPLFVYFMLRARTPVAR
jgi:hypothetical protein